MKNLIFLLTMIVCFSLSGQNSLQKEINLTLWKPFKKAFETLDAKALNSLYAHNTLRVTPSGIDTKDNFKAGNLKRFNTFNNNTKIELDFWFDSRHTNQDTSYEVGFYRIRSTINGKSNDSYGQFHIVLKKLDGTWKITQDWDTTIINGHKIGKEDFEKKTPLKF